MSSGNLRIHDEQTIFYTFLVEIFVFLVLRMVFVTFFSIVHFPPRGTCAGGKCVIEKNVTRTISNTKKTKISTKNVSKIVFVTLKTLKFSDTYLNFQFIKPGATFNVLLSFNHAFLPMTHAFEKQFINSMSLGIVKWCATKLSPSEK